MRNERDGAYDSERWRCAWSDGRERCHFPGVCSHGTRGEGPWYCREHFNCDIEKGMKVLEESRSFMPGNPSHASVPAFEYRAPKIPPRLPYVDAEPIEHFEP
jgi:hypothetical protein